jgi:hypothetical protein
MNIVLNKLKEVAENDKMLTEKDILSCLLLENLFTNPIVHQVNLLLQSLTFDR